MAYEGPFSALRSLPSELCSSREQCSTSRHTMRHPKRCRALTTWGERRTKSDMNIPCSVAVGLWPPNLTFKRNSTTCNILAVSDSHLSHNIPRHIACMVFENQVPGTFECLYCQPMTCRNLSDDFAKCCCL